MKLPSIPKMGKMPQIPKIPKFSGEELREKLPFQSRREFVMHDSEHPVDAAAMEYRPSTGYTPPQAPVPPSVPPHAYRNIDNELPFQQEMVYPGGGVRVPYAAGGQARPEYAGSWPPPPPTAAPTYEVRQPYAPPQQESMPSAFAQAEYYVPRQNYRPAPEYAQPRYYAEHPRQPIYTPSQPYYPNAQAPRPQVPKQPKNAKPAAKKQQPGIGVRLAAIVGGLLPKKGASPSRPRRPQQRENYAPQGNAVPDYPINQHHMPPRPQRPAVSPMEMKYYIWSGSIMAGLALTVISFIYACAA